ncbi:hypothetical protein B0H14DRAFT_3484069 [Mycena olivaceomarginata]|nr:hypothetical protein B0H14DRAFT_3484069 [Mycena olivaceomarginata]
MSLRVEAEVSFPTSRDTIGPENYPRGYEGWNDISNAGLFWSVNSQAGERSAAPSTLRPLTGMHVMIPAFPTAVFQPYEAVFRDRGHTHRTQLVALPKPLRSFFPLRWHLAWLGIVLFLAARVIAKTARRLRREFNAYAAMSDLQGAVILRVVGLYGCKGENSVVFLVSYAGKSLQTFADLATVDG